MAPSTYWADRYVERKISAQKAIRLINSGNRIFIGSSCGEPQHLVKTLSDRSSMYTDLEIVRLMSIETAPLTMIADETGSQNINVRSFYLGSAKPKRIAQNARFLTPLNLSAVPRLFKSRRLPIHVALIQTTEPDDFGWMSLGVSVDITLAAALSADLVIVQVNPKMPRVLGRSFIHVNDVDFIVEHEEPILTLEKEPELDEAAMIAKMVSRLIDDGSTLQISPGTTPQSTLMALADKNDLGIHTQFITNELMDLFAKGVINNKKKSINNGKLIASAAIGSQNLYEFIDDNPAIEFHPSDYVNDPMVIAQNHRMVSLSVAMAVDLTGQVAADALPYNHFCGITGMVDFIRGSFQSEGGKSILLLPSTAVTGKKSRIVPILDDTAVVVPRGDVHYVATEYGVVNLFGKSLQERATAMISIAHPDFRDELFHRAKQMNLLGSERTLKSAIHGVYPLHLEEAREVDGETVAVRPAKPVDERRIQEHFYDLDKEDVVSRFFHEKASFIKDEVGEVSQVDYINNLTIVAVVGEFGFGKVVGVGEYLLDSTRNMAEIAFSVSKNWQGKGIGEMLLKKLALGAKNNSIAGIEAYTSPDNQAMIKLFGKLGQQVTTTMDEEMVLLSCRFDNIETYQKG